jgi:hypothetical protein
MHMRKFGAWLLLFLLIVVPFINWQLGALVWMCAFLVYILQQVFNGNPFTVAPSEEEGEGEEEEEDSAKPDDGKIRG